MVVGRDKVQNLLPKTPESGFTLIELLIAIAIFGIVISSVYGAYRATFNIVHGSEYQMEVADKARVVVERLNEDLRSIVTVPGSIFLGEQHAYADFVGDNLSFVSSAHLVLRKADAFTGNILIQYQSELDMDTGLLNLYRTEIILLPGVKLEDLADAKDGQKHLICQGLLEMRFTYLDRDGRESEEWQVDEVVPTNPPTPPEEQEFPAVVAIELRFAKSAKSENSTVFKTAVALPQPWKKQG
ncbi:prepilin-type N-terminal cleavage/methylation domain-containing protein [Desulfopila sp. IMCC35006]|nr:prepilin-type N-terminal cleavage/methylation domain-containing protein [Desulfopila sp. IMCC35006]